MHYSLDHSDTFTIPPQHIVKVYKRNKFMGWFNASYVYAQQKARLKLKEAMLTFVWIETLVENENRVVINPNAIAKSLGITTATVYNHLAKMQEAGVILPENKDEKVVRVWRVCPFHAWRGKGEHMAKYLSRLPVGHPFLQYVDPDFKESMLEELDESK